VAARLEHQRPADPVVMRQEIQPPLAHGRAHERGAALDHQPHRIAAGVAVETGEGVNRHDGMLLQRRPLVILSEAKDLSLQRRGIGWREVLRCAQDDRAS
jgi:hypothetical protein